MILHVAMFSFGDDVTDDQVDCLTEALHEMADQIDSIVEYRCGPNLRVLDSDVDYAVVATVTDAQGLRDYLAHPAHDAVGEAFLSSMVTDRSAAQLPLPADGP
jgi:hypothetical protein